MAGDKGGPGDATVAYAVTYLYGVIGMLFFCLLALRYRRSDKDTPSPLINRTIGWSARTARSWAISLRRSPAS